MCSCKIDICFNLSITQDNYCYSHRYMTLTNSKHIVEHIKKYINIIEDTHHDERIINMTKLFSYLKYKISWIKQHEKFYKVVLEKCSDLKDELNIKNVNEELKIILTEKLNILHELLV